MSTTYHSEFENEVVRRYWNTPTSHAAMVMCGDSLVVFRSKLNEVRGSMQISLRHPCGFSFEANIPIKRIQLQELLVREAARQFYDKLLIFLVAGDAA